MHKNGIFGISGGAHTSIFDVQQNVKDITDNEYKIGYRVGLMFDRKLFPFLHFIPRADLIFNESSISFKDGVTPNYDVMPMALSLAPHLRIEIEMLKRDPFIEFGPNLMIPVSKKPTETNVFSTAFDFGLDVGIGYARRSFLFFDLAPELRYTYGFRDVSKNPQIDELYLHQVSLIISLY